LPDGGLLTLERVLTSAGRVAKIYKVDFVGGTDTSKIQKLEGAMFTPLKKTLLYERHTFTANYEGITLGPKLIGGWRSLILIADSGGASKHTLMPLRIWLDAK
ncbi:MAG: esterase-like activity of phytase family protein, partial [Verrucomicrobiota bacterium]